MAYEDLFDPADNTKAKAGINLRYGIDAAPDLAARDAALAKRYGLPAGVIEQYRPDYDARAKVEDAGRMLDQSPKLRDWLAADPVRAKVSHDDIGNLSAIEKGIRYLVSAPDAPRGGLISDVGRAGKAIASGAPSAGGALYGAAASIAGLADQYVQTLDDLAALLTGTEKRQIVGTPGPESWLLDQQKQARGVAQGMLPDMQGMSPEERGLWSGLQSGGQNLLTLPLGIVGGEAMMLGTMGAFTFGQSYGKGRETLSPVQSVGFAAQDTVAEVVTEKYLGAGGLLKNIKAGQSAGKLFMYELSKEVPGEIAATIWQNFNEWLNVSPDKSVADFVMEQPDAIRETIVATLVGGTTQIGAVKGVEKVMGLGSNEMDRAMRAEKSALGLDQLGKLVEASKLRERSPEKLAEFTQQLTEESVPNVYVNGTALNQSGVDLQALAEALPSVAAQVQRAVATGGDIVIPTAEFLTITPGQPFAKALIEHARTAPDAMSKAEGTQWMKENGDALQAEIAKVLETRQADDAFQADRQAVQDQFLAQLTQTKRFRPEVNKAYATLLSDFYAAQASRAGMTAQELAQRYPVRIQATAPGGGRSYQQDQGERSKATDAEYLAAIERGDMVAAQKMVDQAARAAGYISAAEYRMAHSAPNSQDNTSLFNLRGEGLVPADYWEKPEWYQTSPEEMESWRKVKSLFSGMDKRGNPGLASMTVYRSVPKDVKDGSIRNGDWVTPSLAYAKLEGESIPGGFKIISQQASAKNLYWDGNSIAELGYDDGQNYAYKNTKNNRKLIDAITRDDNGNVVPLSKRFNSRSAEVFNQSAGPGAETADAQLPATIDIETAKSIVDDEDSDAIPDGWFVHGRSGGSELNGSWPIQMTRDAHVAVGYAGSRGSVWAIKANYKTKVADFTSDYSDDMDSFIESLRDQFDIQKDENGTPISAVIDSIEGSTGIDRDEIDFDKFEEVVRDEFTPMKIVNTAGAFDSDIFISLLEYYPGGWPDMVTTPDGAVVLPGAHVNVDKVNLSDIASEDPANPSILNQSAQLPATIDIDGVQRPTTNSKGQPIATTEEGVRNFWRWFGDSKVVDAEGRPLVVYHGTGGDFTQFDPGRVGENYEKGDERGFFFTSNADEADWAADRGAEVSGGNANIMPVYLSLQDPYSVEVPSYAEARGLGDPSSYFDNNTDQIMMAAEEGDHDGVGIANPERGYSTYIAFDPEQIKSAIGNRGTFDPSDASILNQGKANLAEIRLPDAGVYGNTSVITLFENANLSSLIHEAGHLFLELQADMAGRIQAAIDAGEVVSDGERGIVADMNALLNWFGVKGDETLGGGMGGGALNQPAYHGTPHRGIDRFSTDKIGTGEGAQAYGWGLYFASKRDIAEWYRNNLSKPETKSSIGGKPFGETAWLRNSGVEQRWFDNWVAHPIATGVDVEMVGDRIDRLAERAEQQGDTKKAKAARKLLDMFNAGEVTATIEKGQLYEVDIPEDSDMLLWDKPLSEQPEAVKKALAKYDPEMYGPDGDDYDDAEQGQMIYQRLQSRLGSDKAASEALMAAGIKGCKYLDGTSRNAGDGSFNYVIFSGDDVAIKNTFYQGGEQPEQSGPSPMGRTPLETWLMMSIDERRQMHEQFARGFEAYAFEGKSPSQALNGIFAKFRAWMLSVYKSLKSLNVTLTDEVRQVMDRMLATDEQIAEQQAALKMGPLFATAEQAGMTPEQWAQYQGLAEQATQQAVEALEKRAMKDMAWQRNATARALKAAQRRAAGVRLEVEREVRAEVMSRPVYRAWQFLTGKGDPIDTATPAPKERKSKALDNANDNLFTAIAKLGGLDKAELKAQWGLDTTAEELKSGVFGMPVVRRDNGHSIDRMAEMLVEEGYLLPDENGKANLADLEEAFDAQRRGEDIYSTWYDYAERYKDRGPDLLPDNAIFGKLRTEDLRERYGTGETAIWRKLSDLRMTSDANGIDPDVVAARFEFGSGDELVRALVDARAPQAVIDEETDARMLQEFGDISSPEALQKAADEAVHNEVRARAIAAELSALEEANNVKQKVPGTRRTVDLLAKAAKDYADGVIRALKVRDVRPAQYAAAEVRAANAAAKAFKKGDTAAAAEAKRNQLIQNLAAKAAHKAQADIDSALAYFKRMQKPGKLPAAHFEQIQALLSKFDLRASQSLKSIDNATRHRTWVKAQLDAGNVPPNVDALLTKEQRAAYLRELESRNDDGDLIYPNEEDQALLLAGYIDATPVRSYKEATVEEIIGLRDTIKQIEHIGRRTKKVLADRKNREFQAVVDEMRDRLVEVATKRGRKATDTRSPNDKAGQKRLSWRGYFFSHIKVANLLHIMDGGAGGPMWEHLMKTANDAANGEVLDVAKAHNEIQALLKDVKALGDITDKAIHFPSIGRSLNRQARIVMAMNLGNESNQQRLLAGEGWTMAQVKPVLDTLTAADWKFVQGMWDHFESYRERVGDMEKLINGVEPEWVEARPFSVKAAGGEIIMMRGGYAPVIYDPRANGRAQSFAAEKDAKDMMQAARVASTVSKSFTKARVEEVKGRPLMLSLDAMIGGVQDTIHYLHWQPWIIDANRMIKALDAPLREHYGAEVVKQLREWAGDNAAGVRPARDAAERAVTNLARNVSFAGLAFNVLSAAKQVTGYSQSVAVIGSKWMGKGVAHTLKSPRKAYLEAVEKSDFMKKRATTRMRDLAEVNNTVQDQGKVRDFLDKGGYAMMLAMQSAVDLPTWWGGYEKAINDGKDEIDAVAMADQAVIDSQGSGLQKDLSSIERATGAIRLLTGFMSFMNTTLNVNYRVFKSDQSVPAKAFDLVMVNAIPVALSMILAAALTPGDSGDDDPEKVAKKLAADGLGFMLGQFVGLREIQQIGYAAMGMPQGDYGGAVGLRMFGDTLKLAKQVGQGSWDDAARKAAVNFAGDWFRLPAAQINRSVTGIEALAEGKTTNPGAILTGYQEPR